MKKIIIKKKIIIESSVALLILYFLRFLDTSILSHKIFHDDSYYYFKIAENFIDSYIFTFDGESITNGFHLLWLSVLIVFGLIFKFFTNSMFDISQISLLIQLIIFYLSINKWNKIYSTSLIDKLIVISVHLLFLPYFFNGMETGLTIFLLNIYLLDFVYNKKQLKNTWLILVIFFARYDSVIIIFLVSLFSAFKNKTFTVLKHFALIFIIFIILLSIFNYSIGFDFNTFSTSSTVKQLWSQLDYSEHINSCEIKNINCYGFVIKDRLDTVPKYMANVNKLSFSLFDPTIAYNSGYKTTVNRVFSFGLIIIFIIIFYFSKKTNLEKDLIISLWLIGVAHLALISLRSHLSLTHDWYNYFVIFIYMITLMEVFKNFNKSLIYAFLVFILINSSIYIFSDRSDWSKIYSETVDFLDEYDESVVGTWAAGHIGYYSSNPVVNLEGLVGDQEIIKANQFNNLEKYILENIDLIFVNFDPFEGNSGWFMSLRSVPLIKIQENLTIVKVIKRFDGQNMYIFQVVTKNGASK